MDNYQKCQKKSDLLTKLGCQIEHQINPSAKDDFLLTFNQNQINEFYRHYRQLNFNIEKHSPLGFTQNQEFVTIFNFQKLLESQDPQVIQSIIDEAFDICTRSQDAIKISQYLGGFLGFILAIYAFLQITYNFINTTHPIEDLIIHYLIYKTIKESTIYAIKKTILEKKQFQTQNAITFHKVKTQEIMDQLQEDIKNTIDISK